MMVVSFLPETANWSARVEGATNWQSLKALRMCGQNHEGERWDCRAEVITGAGVSCGGWKVVVLRWH